MKKTILAILLLSMVTTVNAQWWGGKKIKGNGKLVTKERNVGTYDEVSVAGFMDVFLVAGKEGALTIEAEENFMEYIETEVKNGNLKIKIKKGISLRPSRDKSIVITVPFEDISAVSLAGSGDVNSKDLIKTGGDFKASLAGSGDLNLEIDAKEVKGNVAGSGDLRLKGNATSFDCKVAGSGDIHAFDLKANDVEASIAGSGDIRVYCNGVLKARVAGSGDITYRGNPSKEDSKVSGSGDISKG